MQSFIPVDFDPFGEIKEIEKITLTNESQREIWLACVIGGNDANLSYNESVSLALNGHFDFIAFKKSVNDLILRHEALRSTISPNGESFIIYKNYPVDLELEDISTIKNQNEYLKNFVKKEMEIPLDLHEGPLFKVFIQKLNDTKHYFTLIIHHAIGDGWSIGIILEDLAKFYNLYSQGKRNNLEKPAQISDFAIAQTKFQLSQEYQETEDFWLNQYKENVPIIDLPVDFDRKSPRSHKGNRIDYPISGEFANKIKNAGAKVGSSLVTTLLTAFELFIHLKTNNKDIVVGLPASGQQSSELYDLVGHCVNLLPIKSKIDPQKSFIDYLKQRKGEILDAYDHQRLTFGELIKKLYIPRDSSRVTLVPIIFNIDMGMDQAVNFEGLEYKLISNPRAYENFELYLNITGSKAHFILEWSYNTDLFKAETIRDFNNLYLSILEKIVSEPNFIIGDLKTKSVQKLTESTKANPVITEVNQTLNQLINDSVKLYPNEIAVSFKDSSISYSQLNEQANQVAHYLIKQNVNPNDSIALAVERSIEMIAILLAVIKTGSAYVPIDTSYPIERIDQVIKNVEPKCILVSKKFADKYVGYKVLFVEDIFEASINFSKKDLNIQTEKDSLVYILHTSGSTGIPKGVCMNQNALVNLLLWQKRKSTAKLNTKTIQFSPLSFDVSFQEIFATLTTGGNLVLISEDERIDPFKLLDILSEQQINRIFLPFVALQSITESAGATHIYPINLKEVMTAGEQLKITPQIVKFFSRIPDSSLYNQYGPTEAHVVTQLELTGNPAQWPSLPSIGKAIDNTTIYILDENLSDLPQGEIGELCIGGLCLANGYLNLPDLTADKFTYLPTSHTRIYRTGDLAKILPDGNIEFLGRSDHQVKIRGYRIELGEIEAHLNNQNGVKQAVVNAQEDKNGNKKLIAYLTVDALNSAKKESVSWLERWNIMYDTGIKSGLQDVNASEGSISKSILKQITNSDEYDIQTDEWITESTARIKEIGAKRIVEIGCGDGQLITELSPLAELYIATDYSSVAIDYINKKIEANPEKWKNVSALVAEANDFSQISDVSPDLILINSVVQYFSSSNYLFDVIEKAAETIQSGCIFIGDVQGKNTLRMHHAADQFLHSPDDLSIAAFEERICRRIDIEDELMIDPDFFYLVQKELPNISHVEIQLRKGHYLNETTKYHYDAWLYINSAIEVVEPEQTIDWENLYDFSELEQKLVELPLKTILLRNIPNLRLKQDFNLIKHLNQFSSVSTLGDLRKALVYEKNDGLEPDAFWELGSKLGFQTFVRWANDGSDGNFEAIFIPINNKLKGTIKPSQLSIKDLSLREYEDSINVLANSENSEIIKLWKNNLHDVLPEYMIPSELVILNKIPLTTTGKVDRKALPIINPAVKDDKVLFVEPRTSAERLVSKIWAEILNISNISIKSNFFELGGHSLLAVKVMIAIEKETQRRLPLATLFENSTIESLAKMIVIDEEEIKWDSLVPIKKTGSKTPIYLIHGGGLNVLVFNPLGIYMDIEQPVYGMQALGLNGQTELHYSMEELAERYNSEILNNDPIGPYALAGYSFGGLLAYEMAKKLLEMGKEIKMLGILDTNAAGRHFESTKLERFAKKILRQFDKLLFFGASFFVKPKEVYYYQRKSLNQKIKSIFGSKPNLDEEIFSYEKEILHSYDVAYQNYVMKPLDIEVDLFRVKERIYYLDDPIYLGWKDYATQGVNVHEVPGDHKTFLFPPNDKEFAEILQKTLDSK